MTGALHAGAPTSILAVVCENGSGVSYPEDPVEWVEGVGSAWGLVAGASGVVVRSWTSSEAASGKIGSGSYRICMVSFRFGVEESKVAAEIEERDENGRKFTLPRVDAVSFSYSCVLIFRLRSLEP